jgi:hypothetical protein
MTGEQAVSFPMKKYKYNSFGESKRMIELDKTERPVYFLFQGMAAGSCGFTI